MLDIFRSLRTFVKISRVHTDGNVFRLHYAFTVIILMLFCIVITTRSYVGEPIDCITASPQDKGFINTYCWTQTTFSSKKAYDGLVGTHITYPGVGLQVDANEKQTHRYYQWICMVLFFQAAAFYIPRYLWKLWEFGKVEAVVMHLDVGIGYEPDLALKRQAIVDYLYHSSGHHDWYAARYYFCEILSFVNVIAQMFLLDKLFEGRYLRFGLDVIEYLQQQDQDNHRNPMTLIFPQQTKCKVYRNGPSASIEYIDALCVLPLNVMNEKIYLFIWFWFVFLSILTFFVLMFGLIIMASPSVRVYMLNMRFKMSQLDHLDTIVRKATIGDWFLLYLVGKNIDSYIMKDIIKDLALRYNEGKEYDQRMA